MGRGGISIALLLCVIVALYVAPTFSQFAHQLRGDVQPRSQNLKSTFHAEEH